MKKLLVFLTLGLLLINCNSHTIEKPMNLLDEDQMVAILYDLYLVNAIKSSKMNYIQERDITSANYIFQKYKVDSLQFSQSDLYYASDIEEYERLYRRVTERIQENRAVIDSLNLKSTELEEKRKKPTVVVKSYKVRDSLKKIRLTTTTLVKDSITN
jgi:hypothetical protein